MEAFFVNDADQYFEVEVSPQGHYIGLLLDGVRNAVLISGPQFLTTVEVHNPCLSGGNREAVPDCQKIWSVTAVIPREYLPPNITRFNAHAIHGNTWGEISPAEENKSYESLYPVDPEEVKQPDFHHLPAYQPIDLSAIGYEDQEDYSETWKHALGMTDKTFR